MKRVSCELSILIGDNINTLECKRTKEHCINETESLWQVLSESCAKFSHIDIFRQNALRVCATYSANCIIKQRSRINKAVVDLSIDHHVNHCFDFSVLVILLCVRLSEPKIKADKKNIR